MKQFRALIIFTLFVLMGASFSSTAQARPLLKSGDKGTDVLNLNKQLGKLGYLPSSSVGSTYSDATFQGVMAYQKVRGLTRDGVAGASTRKRLKASSDVNSRPQPRTKSTASKWMEVDIEHQVLLLVRNGKVVRTIAISSGAPGHDTPRGSYNIFRKEQMSWSVPFKTWLPWASYFTTSGIAFHEYASVPPTPASHGCVRISKSFAKEVYSFASFNTPVRVV